MTVDYIVSSLPALAFGQPAPMSWDGFVALCGDRAGDVEAMLGGGEWADLETQLRNAAAQARAGDGFARPARGCSTYRRDRGAAGPQEKDVLRRDEMIERVWWDAAGALSPAPPPLGMGALATYAVRLKIALRRDMISKDKGNEAFDRLTAETKK